MIKIFRKIRQNQIMENKTGKYFKYAIGEIILVVIGILIALQINNWNGKRSLRTQEVNILKSLKADLTQASTASKKYINVESTLANQYVFVLSGNEARNSMLIKPNADSLYTALLWNVDKSFPIINTYTDLKNSGRTNLISNEEIRIKFSVLENSLYGLKTEVDDRLNFQQMQGDQFVINDFNFIRSLKAINHNYPIDYGIENDYITLFSQQKFLNFITAKLRLTLSIIGYRKSLLVDIEDVIALIDHEIIKNQ